MQIDLIHKHNPEIGFRGKVNKTPKGFFNTYTGKSPFILHMPNNNKMIVTPEMMEEYIPVILGEEENKPEE